MKSTILRDDDPMWPAFLDTVDHDVYHLPAYARLTAEQEDGSAMALLVEDGECRLFVPLIVRPIPESIIGNLKAPLFDASSPYGYPGPIALTREEPLEPFLDNAALSLIDCLRANRVVNAFIRMHPILELPLARLQAHGAIVHHGGSVVIDLTLSQEELWRQTRHNHRRDVNKASRSGVTVRMDESWRAMDTFMDLYVQTMHRVEAAEYYFFSDSYFRALREALGPKLHLCVVEHEETIISAGLFTESCGIVQYHLSGTAEASLSKGPLKSMIHFARTWAKERGNRVLNLGGGLGFASDELYRFKGGFSDLVRPFYSWRIVADQVAHRELVAPWEKRSGRSADSHGAFSDL